MDIECSRIPARKCARTFFVIASIAVLAYAEPFVARAYAIEFAKIPAPHFFGQTVSPARTGQFISQIISAVKASPERTLWSAYPASVRGQLFGGTMPGNDPLVTGGW
jgi:hypothetical protein